MDVVRFLFGVLGDMATLFLIVSPVQAVNNIRINESVGDVDPYSIIGALCNSAIWALYGGVHGDRLVLVINLVGVVFQLTYICVFLNYANGDESPMVALGLVGGVLAVGTVCSISFGLGAPKAFGYVGVVTGIGMYILPLFPAYKAHEERNVELLNPVVSLAMAVNALLWFIYSIIIVDYFVLVPQMIGMVSAAVQLAVYHKLTKE